MNNQILEINRDNFQDIAERCLNGKLFGRFITSRQVSFYTNDLHRKQLPSSVTYVFRGNYSGNGQSIWEYNRFGYSTGDNCYEMGDIVKFEPLERYVFEFYQNPSKLLGWEIMNKLTRVATKITENGLVTKSRYTNPD